MNSAMAQLNATVGDDVPTFEEVRRKIDVRLAKAQGMAELQGTSIDVQMLEVQRVQAESEAQARLQELADGSDSRRCVRRWWRLRSPTWGSAHQIGLSSTRGKSMLTTIAPGRVPEHRGDVDFAGPHPTAASHLAVSAVGSGSTPGPAGPPRLVTRGRTALVVNMVWAAVSTGFLFAQSALFEHFGGSTLVASVPDLVDEQHDAALVGGTRFLLLVVTGVIWLVWWAKAHAAASVRRDVRAGRGWAIGSWFVPSPVRRAQAGRRRPLDRGLRTRASSRRRGDPIPGWCSAGGSPGWHRRFVSFSTSGNGTTVSDVNTREHGPDPAPGSGDRRCRAGVPSRAHHHYRFRSTGRGRGTDSAGFRTLVVAATVVVLVVTAVGCRNLFDVVPDQGHAARRRSASSTMSSTPGSRLPEVPSRSRSRRDGR